MSILITGGAGFIGSATAKICAEAGRRVTVLDNLSTGRMDRVRWGDFCLGDIRNVQAVREVLRLNGVTTVVHLAAHANVGESIAKPAEYYSNNVSGTTALLEAMLAENVRRVVFASSCSVYGNTASLQLREDHDVHPVSPYGESKMIGERMLDWYGHAYGLQAIKLRYFNVAGADPEAGLGEDIESSLRIVPRALHAALRNVPLQLFGTDFDTVDGTAVRDYVHVRDVADANLRAIEYLESGRPNAVMNLGTGHGVSVRQIGAEVGRMLGKPLQLQAHTRREGDVPYAVSDAARAVELLGWRPASSTLAEIVDSVVRYCQRPAAGPATPGRQEHDILAM
jgi:UDP-glucose-4-epimerase GalE